MVLVVFCYIDIEYKPFCFYIDIGKETPGFSSSIDH